MSTSSNAPPLAGKTNALSQGESAGAFLSEPGLVEITEVRLAVGDDNQRGYWAMHRQNP